MVRVGGELTKKVSDSLRRKCERIAQTTTDSAPMGVTRIASVNALTVSLVRHKI